MGQVCVTEIDFASHTTFSRPLCLEPGQIVQLSYAKPRLAVSSTDRTVLVHTNEQSPEPEVRAPKTDLTPYTLYSHLTYMHVILEGYQITYCTFWSASHITYQNFLSSTSFPLHQLGKWQGNFLDQGAYHKTGAK